MPDMGDKCNFEGFCPYGVETCCDGTERPTFQADRVVGVVEGLSNTGCRGVICEEEPLLLAPPKDDTTTTKRGSGSGDPHFKVSHPTVRIMGRLFV